MAQVYQDNYIRNELASSSNTVGESHPFATSLDIKKESFREANFYGVAYTPQSVGVPAWMIGKAYGEYENYEEAIRWYEKEKENKAFALYRMAKCFLKLKNADKAIPLLKQAVSEYKHIQAAIDLGTLYLVGAYGVPKDSIRAMDFYHEAFILKNPDDRINLRIANTIALYDPDMTSDYFKRAFETKEISEQDYNTRMKAICEGALASKNTKLQTVLRQ